MEDIEDIIRLHGMWLRGDAGGVRADLSAAGLSGADLFGVDLSRAYLAGAYLTRSNLEGANLAGAKWGVNGVRSTLAPIQIHGLRFPVILLDNAAKVGCQLRLLSEWAAMTNEDATGPGAELMWPMRDALLAFAAASGRA